MKPFSPQAQQRGMTLVELMVGIAIGLFLAMVTISVFVSSRTLFSVGSAQSRMEENSRLAMDLLKNDLRQAGFLGCHPSWLATSDVVSTLSGASSTGFLDVGTAGIQGYDGGTPSAPAGTFSPSLPGVLTALANPPIAGSDVIAVRVPADDMALGLATPMSSTTDSPNVGTVSYNSFKSGDVAYIADCKGAAMFVVTGVSSTGQLQHATSSSGLGNSTTDLQRAFQGDAGVYRLQTHYYYVANSVLHPGTHSLWMYVSPDGTATEVATGIDALNASFGVDTNSDQAADQYMTADAVPAASWDSVVSVQIQLLSSTTQDNVTRSNVSTAFAGGTVNRTDHRLQTAMSEVIALRNKAP